MVVKSLPEHRFVSNPANTDEPVFIVQFNVIMLSQPACLSLSI